ncbi:MAG: hypothetical protein DHS20C01_03710 [marine bacterium B5-7]|nr:MAG: hypothetical protein DHS20C01_03710 [marine bacterium B5-7]
MVNWLVALVLLGVPASVQANFEVLSGRTKINSNAIVTNAELDLELSDAVAEALDQGIEIDIVAEIRLYRIRPYIWDEEIARWRIDYRLKHHDLSTTYVVRDDRSNELETFVTLREAMDFIADFNVSLPVVTETLPQTDDGYRVAFSIYLDRGSLPPPLKLIADFSPNWHLGSRWKQWSVEQ